MNPVAAAFSKHALVLLPVLLVLLFHTHVEHSKLLLHSLFHARVEIQHPAEVLPSLSLVPHLHVGLPTQVEGLYRTWSTKTNMQYWSGSVFLGISNEHSCCKYFTPLIQSFYLHVHTKTSVCEGFKSKHQTHDTHTFTASIKHCEHTYTHDMKPC